MEYTTVRNNKDTNGILKFEKQEITTDLLESKEIEQSDIRNLQKGKEQMKNQFFKEEKIEENVNTSKKATQRMKIRKSTLDYVVRKLKFMEKVKGNNKNQNKIRKTVNK